MEKFYVNLVREYKTGENKYTETIKRQVIEGYLIDETHIKEITDFLIQKAVRKVIKPVSKSVRCIETGQIFGSKLKAAAWLLNNGIIKSYGSGENQIRAACNGKKEKAYGYHWEYVN